jgi:hypothetical protein
MEAGVEAGWNLPPSFIAAEGHGGRTQARTRSRKAVLASERALRANNLWSVVVGFIAAFPGDASRRGATAVVRW